MICRRFVLVLRLVFVSLAMLACQQVEPPDESEVGVFGAPLTAADCPSGTNVLIGTATADTLVGTSGDDCLVGLGGSDFLYGGGGNDFLIGGNGNDRLYGELGDDRLYGEAGDDVVEGGDGGDLVFGGAGSDTINGGSGADLLHGDDGADTIHGGGGADRIFGEANTDFLYGDDGADILDGGNQADQIWGGAGDDVVFGNAANDRLYGEDGDDAILGGAGSNVVQGGAGTDACDGTGCELPALVLTGCTQSSQCASNKQCIAEIGLCLGCVVDEDSDGVCDSQDACDADPEKSAPGSCGCGASDADADGDGTPDCNDGCPFDAAKLMSGACGCGTSDVDSDGDGTPNCVDQCPSDPAKVTAGACGCGTSEADTDGDGTPNCNDGCPVDASKLTPGVCGCGASDADSDADGTADCNDGCPADPAKLNAGACGCGAGDVDSDSDGTLDCNESCASDPEKLEPGVCGCGVSDVDSDGDASPDCVDECDSDPTKFWAGECGCGVAEVDADQDSIVDCNDVCPRGYNYNDGDADGVPNACDVCPGSDDTVDNNSDGIPDGCSAVMAAEISGLYSGAKAFADFDEDCDIDAIGGYGAIELSRNDGSGAFSGTPLGVPLSANEIAAGDLDGDGHWDVAVFESNWPNTTLSAVYGDGAGNFVQQGPTVSTPYDAFELADITGDGALDAVYANGSVYVAVAATPPARGFVATLETGLPTGEPIRMTTGDFDLDGTAEILVASAGELFVYHYDPSQSQGLQVESLGTTEFVQVASLVVGQLGGDSHRDLIVVGGCSWPNPCSFTLYEGQQPNPALSVELQSDHAQFKRQATHVVAADLSGIGRAWLVDLVADATPDLVLSSYARSMIYRITWPDALLVQDIALGASRLFSRDIDNDGAEDLVFDANSGGTYWFRGVDPSKQVGPDRDGDGICNALDLE